MRSFVRIILENNIENEAKSSYIVSGYFNPIHKRHIEYFQNAKTNGAAKVVEI